MSVSYGGDTITFADSSTISSGWTGFKNRIINGAMVIDQRYAGANTTPTTGGFVTDRWAFATNVSSKLKIGQNLNSITPPIGFSKYIGIQTVSAYSASAGEYFGFYQPIEGLNLFDLNLGSSSGSPFTVSFWVRSSITGTNNIACSSQYSANATISSTYTINQADTWEKKTITIQPTSIGTWDTTNGLGMFLWFDLGSGSNYQGTGNTWSSGYVLRATGTNSIVGTLGATLYITGVQLEKGSTASSFEYRPYGTELGLCQRYYNKSYSVDVVPGTNTYAGSQRTISTAGGAIINFTYPVEMRAAPTITPYSVAGTSGVFGSEAGNWTPSATNPSTRGFGGYGNLTSGYWVFGQYVASSEL